MDTYLFNGESTVKFLIEALSKLPQDATVHVCTSKIHYPKEIESISFFEHDNEVVLYGKD